MPAAIAKEKVSHCSQDRGEAGQEPDKSKASAHEKTDKVLANDEVGKDEAKDRKLESEAVAKANKNQKYGENAQDKDALKHDVNVHAAAVDKSYKNVDTGVMPP